MRMEILYQFNEKYVPYAGVSITSLLINHQDVEDIRIWILGEELQDASAEKLRNLANEYHRKMVFLETTELINKMKSMNMPTYRGSYAANMRLFLPEVLDETVDRLLYLDADTIIDKNIQELFTLNMKGYPIGMIMDSLGDSHKQDIGLSKNDRYYNSGVLLFQMRQWRNLKLTERIVEHVVHVRPQYPAPDQDLLNLICRGKIYTLPIQYNYHPVHMAFTAQQYQKVFHNPLYYSVGEIDQAREQPSIYHVYRFIGRFPWDQNNNHPGEEIFDKYLHLSPWSNYEKTNKSLSLFIKMENILYNSLPKGLFLYLFKWMHRGYMVMANLHTISRHVHNDYGGR